MKKWLVALALCLTLCLCACAALADDHLAIIVSNAEVQNGAVSGAYYYKLYADTNQHSFLMGWSTDTSAEEPDRWYSTSLDWWYPEGDDYYIVTTPPFSGEYSADALFYRISEDDPWQRLVFNYDVSLQETAETTGMTENGPSVFDETYTLEWDAVDGADAYFVHMIRPDLNGQEYRDMIPVNSYTFTAPDYNETGRNLWPIGAYECWVEALANDELISPAAHTHFTVSPALGLGPWNEDFVVPGEDGVSASILMNQWIELSVTAPGANMVHVYELANAEEALTEDKIFDSFWPDENGEIGINWVGLGQHQAYSRVLVAEAVAPDGTTYLSAPFTLQVGYEGEIQEDIVFDVSHTDNVYDEETGRFIVPRDGMLYVDVQNMDANFFGLYINDWIAPADSWLADSHWVDLSDGETTRLPLTVPRCQAGEDYEVTVCAIRFGYPQKDAAITIPIHVTEAATDSDIIVTMEREYIVGEPIRVFAYYANPDGINGNLQIRIREKGTEDNVVYEEVGDFYDYWDTGAVIWQSGTFVVDARVWQFDENGASIREDHQEIWEFTVNAFGRTAAPQIKAFSTFPAGQDLILTLYAEADEDTVMPDWFEAALFRVDWGGSWIGGAGSDELQDGMGTLTYDKNQLDAGGVYWIRLFSMKPGYEVGTTEFRFVVVDETAARQDLTVTVDGSTDEDQEILSSTNLKVRVGYEGNRPTVIRILNGDHWEHYRSGDEFSWDWGFGDDELLLYAEGSDDDIDFDALDNNDGWRDFNWDTDVNWNRKSNLIRLHVSSPYGVMAVPSFSIENPEMAEGGSGVIPWGDNVSLLIADEAPMALDPNGGEPQAVQNGWFYCNLYVQQWDDQGNNWWDRADWDYHYEVHSGLNTIYTYNLEGGHRYRLEIGADGEGYSGRAGELEFELGEKPEDLQEAIKVFTVNGESEQLAVQTREEMQLVAYYSYGEWYSVEICQEDNEDWYEDRNRNANGMFLDSWCANQEGTYILQAYAYGYLRDDDGKITQDENGESEWRELIGTVTVTASADNGDLDPVEASISTDVAFLGDEITLTFSGPDDAEFFNYWVHPVWDGWWVAGGGVYGFGTSSIDTDRLESGVYCAEIDAQAVGYNQSHKNLYFALLDENDQYFSNDSYIFTISTTEVPTETEAHIVAYLRGADAVRAYCSKDGQEIQEFRYEDDPGLSDWFSRGEAGSYAIYISGEYDGVWSEPEQVCVLEITADNQFESAPVLTVNGSAQGDMVPVDEDNPGRLTVSIQRDEAAQGYHLMVRKLGEDWTFFDRFVNLNDPDENTHFVIGEDTVSVTIENENIRQGGIYEIECYAHAPGYESAGSSHVFLLQPTTQQNLTVKVNGSAEDAQDILSSTDLNVRVSYGGNRPTAIRFLNGDHWEHWWGGDSYERDWSFGDGEILLYAEGTDDDIDFDALNENNGWDSFDWDTDVNWNRRSNLIRLNISSPYGEMAAPSFTIENDGDVIPWGDNIIVQVNDPGPMARDPEGGEDWEVENGWFYCNLYVQRWSDNGEHSWWNHVNYDYNYPIHSGLNEIFTFNLEGGCRYRLEIGADGEGYSGRSGWAEFELGEKPEDTGDAVKVFTVNGESLELAVQTYEEMRLIAYHSHAEWYSVEIRKQDSDDWYEDRNNIRNGMLMESWRANEAGTYTLEAYATGYAQDGNEWRELIGTVTVTASADNGDMDPVEASISTNKAYTGEDITLTFSGPDIAENFNYWVHPVWDGRWVAGDGQNGIGTATFGTGNLESGVYHVEIDAQAVGYNESHKNLYFALLDENDEDFSTENYIFTISTTDISTEADVRIIAYLPGADAVSLYFSKNGEELEEFRHQNDPGLDTWFSRGDTGSYAIYVSGEYDGEWSEPEQVCVLEITAKYEFDSAPAVTVNGSEEGSIVPLDDGDPGRLNISILRDENAHSYHLKVREYGEGWYIFDESVYLDDEENYGPFAVGEDTVSITIEDEIFQQGGIYEVECYAHAPGYAFIGTRRAFVLQPTGEENLILTVNGSDEAEQDVPSSANLFVKVAYEGDRPTAIRVMNGNHWEYWWNGDQYNRNWSYGDDQLLMYAEGTDDEIDLQNGDFRWDTDVNWNRRSNAIRLNVTSPYGEMAAPNFTIENDGVIPWGESIAVRVNDAAPMALDPEGGEPQALENGWFFGNLFVQRWNDNGDHSWWDHVNYDYGYPISSGLNLIPTFNLEGGCRYRLEIGADGEGYGGSSSRMEFELGEKPEHTGEALKAFTVNGAAENLAVQTHEDMQLIAYHSDAEWYDVVIRMEGDDGWRDSRSTNRDGMLLDYWCANMPGSYTMEAYAFGGFRDEYGNRTVDENGNDEWRELIGTVHVTVTSDHGELNPVSASVTDWAYAGQDITLTFSGPEEAEDFNYSVRQQWNDRWITGNNAKKTNTVTINTDGLESGVYSVDVYAQAVGYDQSYKKLYFALLNENDAVFVNDYVIFSLSDTEVTTDENTWLVAFMPGADAVEVSYRMDGGELTGFRYDRGPGLSDPFSRGVSGTFVFYVSGEFDGEWTEPLEVGTLVITAEYEFAADPVVTLNGTTEGAAVPAIENDEHRLDISIDRDEEAQSYYILVWEPGDGWAFIEQYVDLNAEYNDSDFEIGEDSLFATFWDDRIEPGQVYTVECFVHAQGYESRETSRTFVLQREGQQNVTLEVSPIDDEGFWTGREVHVTASAPDATALYIRMNNEERWYRGNSMDERWSIWDTGTMFYAYATTDPIPEDDDFPWHELNVDWSMQSEPIWIEANTLGDTEIPTLTFNDHVTKGDWLEITVGDDADARQIDVRISDDNGETFEFRRLWSPGVYKLSTAYLNAGQRYWVWLSCVQDKHLWTNGQGLALYVDEPEDGNPFFRTDKTTLYPGECFIPTVYAPGAVHIWIENTDDEGGLWGDWDGETATNHADWEWWYDDPGEFSLTAWALYPDQEERTRIGDVVFTVLEPTGLEAPEISVAREADVTQDIDVCVTPVEYGYDYCLQLHWFGQDEADWIRWNKNARDVDQESGQLIFTIPAYTMEANKPYWIDVYVDPARDDYAHTNGGASVSIMTVDGDERDESITLALVPGASATVTDEGVFIPINTGFGVTVTATGSELPTAIAIYMGDHTEYRFFNDADGSAETEYVGMSEYQPCPETIFARASYDDLSDYDGWEAVPWSDLNWGSPSNSVLVTFTANGHADPPEIFNHWATIRGRDMIITVTLGANANEAHANIDRILGGWEQDLVFDRWIGWEPTEGTENQGTITIPTDDIPIGTYRLYVDNSGEGYDNSRTTVWFLIVEDPFQSASKLVLPSGLQTIEEGAFEGIAADTVIIPEGVTTIGRDAFRSSQVRLVVIPDSVTSIGEDAFAGTNLYIVYGFNAGPALQLVYDTDAAAFCFIGD